MTFQGGDAGANSTDPRPISTATAASFNTAAGVLGTVNVISFESSAVGQFTSLVPATGVTLTGTDINGFRQTVVNVPAATPDGLYGFNTTSGGQNFISLAGGTLTFSFATPISAFGAYITGLQTPGNTLTFNDGSPQSITITNLASNGGVQFLGFTDIGASISSLTLNATVDIIGVDDVRYARASAVPEPGSLLLCGLSGAGLAVLRLVRRSR